MSRKAIAARTPLLSRSLRLQEILMPLRPQTLQPSITPRLHLILFDKSRGHRVTMRFRQRLKQKNHQYTQAPKSRSMWIPTCTTTSPGYRHNAPMDHTWAAR